MNYELAKKLKDAGFPGLKHLDYLTSPEGYDGKHPTLSELVELCGDKLNLLHKQKDGTWKAGEVDPYGTAEGWGIAWYTNSVGTTPEEAVAHLWLALNEKK